MGDEEVMGSVSPAPSDHKRKLDELDSEPFEQPPVSAESNGNSHGDDDNDGDAAPTFDSTEDPDVKRPRIEDNSDGSEATENGHHEERVEEETEDTDEPSQLTKNAELEDDQGQLDEPLDDVNKDSITDEPQEEADEQQADENIVESSKEEHQESGLESHYPTTDVASQEDVSDLKEQSTSSDQLTSRRMEVPTNKVGVLIGKGGDTIRTLQYSSGARIQITRDSEANQDSATRSVELIGSLENINKAERLIKDVIAEAEAGGSPSLVARGFSAHSSGGMGEQVHIQVPNEKVGVIIGKGGETIKNLQSRSGARIQLIPQHLPDGDQSRERTVRVTGDRKQIETAKELIKEVMEQPPRSSTPSGGHNQQNYHPRGQGSNWGGPRGGGHHHSHSHSQQSGYNNNNNYYPPSRGGGGHYPSQNQSYSSPGYGNYPPQQPPPKNSYGGWDQRPPSNMQGPPDQTGYDYYGGQQQGPPTQPPMHSHGPGPTMGPPPSQVNYNYGPPQGGGPDYGQQPPASYPQTAPQGYGQGYGEPRYDQQHSYGGQGTQASTYPQNPGYGQQYNMPPQQGPYGQQYGPPRPQPYPVSTQQPYPQYGTAPTANDGYSQTAAAPTGYGQPVSGYGQQAAPAGYAPVGPTTGYSQYPSTQQPGYGEQAAPNSTGYGYQQGAADPSYGGGQGMGYGAPPPVQPTGYSQPTPALAPVPVQPGYDQSVPQTGGYAAPQPQPQAQALPQPQPQPQAGGYGQYDTSQMYR